jgi:plasmid stabilization system protein ParE
MKVSFLKVAQNELDSAYNYYEAEQSGLGDRFQREVAKSISRIVNQPKLYQPVGKYSRRCLVHTFPYSVIYQIRSKEDLVLIVAIANLHRKPDYWVNKDSGS